MKRLLTCAVVLTLAGGIASASASAVASGPTVLAVGTVRVVYHHTCGIADPQLGTTISGGTPIFATMQGAAPGQWVAGVFWLTDKAGFPGYFKVCLNKPADGGIGMLGYPVGVWVHWVVIGP